MTREIKFRAWQIHLKRMYENIHVLESFSEMLSSNQNYIVMQFTGLKDKNGKEIWEGDVVRTWLNHHGKEVKPEFISEVVYNEHIGAWQIAYKNSGDGFSTDTIWPRYILEVIGNIYQNPELVKATS